MISFRDKKKDKVAPKVGVAAGATIAGTGAALAGTGKYFEKKLAGLSEEELEKRLKGVDLTKLKNRGAILIPIGAGVAAVSTYAHYKNKKKDNKKDDNTKK